MNDEHFSELAMKVIARQANPAERAELDAAVAAQQERKAEFARLEADARLAQEVLPLVDAVAATNPELPAYARQRLQSKVKRTLRPAAANEDSRHETERISFLGWRWLFGLGLAVAAAAILLVPLLRKPGQPVIQLAMLDMVGAVRGGDTNVSGAFRALWPTINVENFSQTDALEAWEGAVAGSGHKPAAWIVYDRPKAEVRVTVRCAGAETRKTFPVDGELSTALAQARRFVEETLGEK